MVSSFGRGRTLTAVASAFLIAACADQASWLSAPTVQRSHDLLGIGDLITTSTNTSTDTITTVLLIDPSLSAGYGLGHGNRLVVSAGGICDLGSEYRPGTWDSPCVPAV